MKKSFFAFCSVFFWIFSVVACPVFSAPGSPPLAGKDEYSNRIYSIAMYGKENGKKQWLYFSRDSLHHVNFGKGGSGLVTFYVGVPKYSQDDKYQVLFVRTSYRKNQPVALMKNGPVPCFFPFFSSYDDVWDTNYRSNNAPEAYAEYLSYHKDKRGYDGENRKQFNLWHNNSSWNLNCRKGT